MVALVVVLKQLADRHWPLGHDALFWSSALAIVFSGPFLHRDLVELGVNTFLVLLTWLAIYLWISKQDLASGALLGLATALKCTPIVFIAYFFWKRQWKIALASCAFAGVFTLLPMTIMGWKPYWQTEKYWATQLWGGLSDPDPSHTVMGPDRVGNLSLRTALARYLMHLPYGNPARPETPVDSMVPNHPPERFYFDVLTLPPAVAGRVIKIILLAIAGATAWVFRRRITDRNDVRILWECAAVSVAALIYSPLTWAQHGSAVLPAFYFLFRAAFAGRRLPRDVVGALIYFFVVICVLQSGLIGWRLTGLLDAYHLRNFALVGLFWATLRAHRIISSEGGHSMDLEAKRSAGFWS
jgi:alpha-1,2-mannosyltransferase